MTGSELAAIGPVAVLATVAWCLYEVGRRRLAAGSADGAPAPGWPWLCRAGIALGVLILLPPIGRWGASELFARAMVDVALAYVVAPLLLLGAVGPALAAAVRGGGKGTGRGRTSGSVHGHAADTGVTAGSAPPVSLPSSSRPLLRPVGSVVVFLAVVGVWHIPAVLDATAGSTLWWDLQMASYLAAGLLLWSQLVGSLPIAPTWDPLARICLGVVVLGAVSILGAAMLFSQGSWYTAFDGGRQPLLPATIDQAFAGAILGVVPAIPIGSFAWWSFTEWIRRDEDDDLHMIQLAAAGDATASFGAARSPRHSMEERTR